MPRKAVRAMLEARVALKLAHLGPEPVNRKDAAREAVVEHFNFLPASQVRSIIERYHREVRAQALRKNPRVLPLTTMKVGEAIPWEHAYVRRSNGAAYMQTADQQRARLIMDEPGAKWTPFMQRGVVYVRRTA